MNNAIVQLKDANRLLAEVRTIQDAQKIISLAEAARVYAQQANLGLEAQNYGAEIKLRAARHAGKILSQSQMIKGRRSSKKGSRGGTDFVPTLQEIGINKKQSHRWQLEASIPEEVFEKYVAEVKQSGSELTSIGLYKLARQIQGLAVHYSSDTYEWYTPTEIIECVLRVLGEINLDPCSNEGEPNIPALSHFTVRDDGLAQNWFGRVYMNPPYGRVISLWAEKLNTEFIRSHVIEAIALVPARTDTDWFRLFRDCAICFIDGRLRFSGMNNSAPFPSAAIYFGKDISKFDVAFRDMGDVWVRWKFKE